VTNKALLIIVVVCVTTIQSMFVWRLFADGKLTAAP